MFFVATCTVADVSEISADEAQWIWKNGSRVGVDVPQGEVCFFRKLINLRMKAVGRIEIAADDQYEVFVNGKSIGSGSSARQMQEYDITNYLEVGRNVIAVRVVNTHGNTAAMAARVSIRPGGSGKWYTFSSSPSWRTSTEQSPMWETVLFNDRLWGSATAFGKLGDTVPWDRDVDVVAEKQTEQRERFQIQKGFGVQRVLSDEQVGSIIAMTFPTLGTASSAF